MLPNPFRNISSLFSMAWKILNEVVDAVFAGNHFGGVEGSVNAVIHTVRRSNGTRADGSQLTSPFVVDGVRMCNFFWFSDASFKRAIDAVSALPIRDDDIFVVSYQKCGHHFLHEILHMLVTGEVSLHKGSKDELFLEMYPFPTEHFSSMPSPRVILTHLPWKMLPKEAFKKNCKIIRASRNPKDMFVSYYHHCLALKGYFYDDTFENFMRLNLDEPCEAENGSYFAFEREYLLRFRSRPNVVHVTFENLKKRPAETIRKLGVFLGFDYSTEFYEQVAIETDFAKVKKAKDPIENADTKDGRSMYRRGAVGDWRRHFTVALNDSVDARIEKEWGGTELMTMFDYGDESR